MQNPEVAVARGGHSWFQTRKSRVGVWVFLLIFASASLRCVAQTNAKNVLVLYTLNNPQVAGAPERLESAVRSRVPMPVNFYVEDLDFDRIGDPLYDNRKADSLHGTYMQQKFDLVMVSGYMALQFALQHRDELFPGVPIVFFTVISQRMVGQKIWPGVTGVTETIDLSGTINYALKFHPNAQAIAVISSNTGYDPYWLNIVRSDLALNHRNIKEIDHPHPCHNIPSADMVRFRHVF